MSAAPPACTPARPLAELGYRVRVVDPVPEHVAEAASLPGVTAALGDARQLAAPDASVDAVLLLGPLYHLQQRADRVGAWREAARVVRPGGVVAGASISRFASLFDGLLRDLFRDPGYRPVVEETLRDGRHNPPDPERNWFTTAYCHHPDELAAEAAEAGLVVRRRVSVESPLWMAWSRMHEILTDPELTAPLLEMLRLIEDEPTLLGASSHLLTVAIRPK